LINKKKSIIFTSKNRHINAIKSKRMKPGDLRIGNVVDFMSHPCSVVAIDGDNDRLITAPLLAGGLKAEIGIDNFKPVNLTEEWLIKLGFKCVNLHWKKYTLVFGARKMDFKFIQDELSIYDLNDSDQYFDIPAPSFVHQLQNLYYSLTGKELLVKSATMKVMSPKLFQELIECINHTASRTEEGIIKDINELNEKATDDQSVD
jgi:hypothetical protein